MGREEICSPKEGKWNISEEDEEDLSVHGGAERLGAHRGARKAFPLCLPLPAHSRVWAVGAQLGGHNLNA